MYHRFVLAAILAVGVHFAAALGPYDDPHFAPGRTAIVHLFEWRWDDIADECERFLGPKGFGGVQISPPMEHVMIWANADSIVEQPWYERYQVVSYRYNSRSGTEDELRDMVQRCNNAGVRIYADVIPNHMTYHEIDEIQYGSGGSEFNGARKYYPAVPYNESHFIGKNRCHSGSGGIENWGDAAEVRNCELVGLIKLDLTQDYVRDKVAGMFNGLIDMGLAGFRVDAVKHMWPGDLEAIWKRFHTLSTDFFEPGLKPFIFMEAGERASNDVIKNAEYFQLGRAVEFRYGYQIAPVLRKWNNQLLKYLINFGEGWGMSPTDHVVSFIANHDSERNEWATPADPSVITFWEPKLNKMAHAFMLAFPYGIPRIISSYRWQRNLGHFEDKNSWVGPPHVQGTPAVTIRVPINGDGTCGGGWVCQHRWRQITNMVRFRNVAASSPLTHWWDNGFNAIAFGRADRGFIVMNNENFGIEVNLQTGMGAGKYCDVISGDLVDGRCTGAVVEIGGDGRGHFSVANMEDPIVAIHAEAKLPEGGNGINFIAKEIPIEGGGKAEESQPGPEQPPPEAPEGPSPVEN